MSASESSSSSNILLSSSHSSTSSTISSSKSGKRKRRKERQKANKRHANDGKILFYSHGGPSAKTLAQRRRRIRCNWKEAQFRANKAVFVFLGDSEEMIDDEDMKHSSSVSITEDDVVLIGSTVMTDADDESTDSNVFDTHKKSADFLKVKPSSLPGAGQGLFTTENISKNTVLLPYVGVRLDFDAFKDKYALDENGDATRNLNDFKYILELPGKTYIDASDIKTSNASRFVNHNLSKRCNCIFTCKGNLVSTKKIFAGEELFVNYAPWFSAYLRRQGIVFATDEDYRTQRRKLIEQAKSEVCFV